MSQNTRAGGLQLLGVDGVVWRTQDTATFSKSSNQHGETAYPQVRMVCQMELSSHLITASAFDSFATNEMHLAARLAAETADDSITLFDKVFYSLGLLHHWQDAGNNRHWRFVVSFRVGLKCVLPEFGAVVRLNGEFVHIVQLGANHLTGTQLHGKE